MKKKAKLAFLISMVAFATVVAVTGSIAWFSPTASIEKEKNPVTGTVLGAYFAYGNGIPTTEGHPNDRVYGITNPRHLYNLAWLQYLGFFNKESENGKQYYFELADNIDMAGWVLPPIGTETHPFIGNFNGNGFVVSNLTISNKFSDYDKHPSDVDATNYVAPHIIGFFGAIGDYNGDYLDSSGNPKEGKVYSSSANEFSNTGLTGLTIHTYLNDTLMGIAAGYVSGAMSNIAVDASTINIDQSISGNTTAFGNFTNISDFSLVGYTTHTKQVKKIDETIYDVKVDNGYASTGKYYEFNANEQGEGETGWGGSIDMMSVTKRLQAIRDAGPQSSAFTWYKEYQYNDGTPAAGNPVATKNYGDSNTDDTPVIINNNDNIGHFHFINETGYTERYALLGGGHYEQHNYYISYQHSGRLITDGTNYLYYDGNTLGNTTDPNTGSLWLFTEFSGNVYYISTTYNGTEYFLYYNNGALGIITGTGTTRRWVVDDSGTYRDIKYNENTNYHLTFNNGWTLINTSGSPYYLISDGNGHYMGAPTNVAPASVSLENAMHFGYSSTGSTRGYYNLSNVNSYLSFRNRNGSYIQISNSNINATYRLYSATNTNTCMNVGYGTGYLRTTTTNADTSYGTTRYVRYNNNTWSAVTQANQATRVTIEYIDPTAFTVSLSKTADVATPRLGPDKYTDTTLTHGGMVYEDDDVTYFPLATVDDSTRNYNPSNKNTAYVVGGSNIDPTETFYDDEIANVRFGYYPINDYRPQGSSTTETGAIKNDYDSSAGTFKKVYTITDGNTGGLGIDDITNSYDDYSSLQDAKTNLGGIMHNQTFVYGLHFMESSISMDALTTADYVSINGNPYTNYELPVNSIDFNLKEIGYITFMAGSYYVNTRNGVIVKRNNSFFSLYQIERNADNTINRILEVVNVYQHTSESKNYSYVYELTDGTDTFFTKPYKVIDAEGNKVWLYDNDPDHEYEDYQYETDCPANYELKFKCAWIKANTFTTNQFDRHVYFFQIPMNDGEFCLGSVDGGVGCYLMYLDIGANASKYQRTIFYERFEVTEKNYLRPDGVALVSLPDPTTYVKETPVININTELDYEDSACVKIIPSAKQTYTMDRNSNTVTLTRSNPTNAPPVYAGEAITVLESGDSTPIEPNCIDSSTKIYKRMTYYDVNVNLDNLTITQVTDMSTNGGASYTRMRIVQKIFANKDDTSNPSNTYVYDREANIDQRNMMKIFNTSNGNKYTLDNLLDTSVLQIPNSQIPSGQNDIILVVRVIQQGNNGYTEDINIHATIDNDNTNGSYYLYENYKIIVTTTDGTVTIRVISIDSGAQVYYGETKATTVGQVITIPVPQGTL